MAKGSKEKPNKETDKDLYSLIAKKLTSLDYIFTKHSKQRLADRNITDIDVLEILEGKISKKRKRNKSKDKYEHGQQDWNYCIEGINIDKIKIRIIISFRDDLLLIITVINLSNMGT